MFHRQTAVLGAAVGLLVAADQMLAPSTARAAEIINLRSGYDEVNSVPLANGAADANITQFSGQAILPLSLNPFTATDYQSARTGPTAFVAQPHPVWVQPASFVDPQARWINWTGAQTPKSVLYAMPFTVNTVGITSATLSIDWAVDDSLGDMGLSPNPDGVYLGMGNAAGVAVSPSIQGGSNNPGASASRTITGMIQTGQNYMYIYQRDAAAIASGTIFSATVTVLPEPGAAALGLIVAGAIALRRPRRAASPKQPALVAGNTN